MPVSVIVWSRPARVQCTATKRELDQYGIPYIERDLTERVEQAAKFRDAGYATEPVVQVAGGEIWAGFRPDLIKKIAERGDACAICGTQDPGKRGWHIDHDHSCCPGKTSCGLCVRGLLCGRCNLGLGFFLDNISSLRAAEAYLERADASATFGETPRED